MNYICFTLLGLRPFLLLSYKVRTVWTLYTFFYLCLKETFYGLFSTQPKLTQKTMKFLYLLKFLCLHDICISIALTLPYRSLSSTQPKRRGRLVSRGGVCSIPQGTFVGPVGWVLSLLYLFTVVCFYIETVFVPGLAESKGFT